MRAYEARALVWQTLGKHEGGLTDLELAAELPMLSPDAIARERRVLRDTGLVEDSGSKRGRTTVWRLAPERRPASGKVADDSGKSSRAKPFRSKPQRMRPKGRRRHRGKMK